ncbi:MAG: serine O-acetyltransferase EpsC [Bacillota bacterium]
MGTLIYTRNTSRIIKTVAEQLTSANQERYEWSPALSGLKKRVIRLVTLLRSAMYPEIFGEKTLAPKGILKSVRRYLRFSARQLNRILKDVMPCEDTQRITCQFIESLVGIADCLESDIKAAYEGDPAARSEKEIMLSYPAFEAISIYRLAHRLYKLSVPLIPRMMTEYAHSITGIDIHPGAKIGKYFFIDHGTGVVIGETCTIGDHVKLYQGVTLGAKSFELDEHGNPIKGIKRHPDIGNHVVIYAGATILGGNTVIGDNCVIGGNVWLTHSLEAGEKIFYNNENIQK